MTADTVDRVHVLSRKDFRKEFARDYQGGQHLTALGPTGRGKSRLVFECLHDVCSPDMQVITLHGKIKGRDPVTMRAAKYCKLRMVPELPSNARQRFDRKVKKYNGYLVVPLEKPGESVAEENELLRKRFDEAIHHNYKTTKRQTITHINEAHQVQHELGLKTSCEGPLMRGAPDNAEWSEAQRGRYLSYHTYNAPEHLFVFYDDNRDERRRYSDFGTGDPEYIEYLVTNLKTQRVADGRTISQCLYIRRSGGMYVVDT